MEKVVRQIVFGLIKYGLPIAASIGKKFWNYSSETQLKPKTGTSGVGVTSQYDKKTVYYKKTMPRYKKRRWLRYVKKVNAVELKGLGTKTIVRNSQLEGAIQPELVQTQQGYLSCTLYGADGTDNAANIGCGDLRDIFNNDSQLNKPTDKAYFGSAILDVTFVNASQGGDAGVGNHAGMEMDVYEFIITRNVDAQSVGNLFGQAMLNTEAINGTGVSLNLIDRGTCPFDFPDALARGFKILKKTKYFLSPGQTATYQMRDPKNYVLRKDNIDDADGNFARRYLTKGIFIVWKNIPVQGQPSKPTSRLLVGATRKYMYKVMETNEDQDQLL